MNSGVALLRIRLLIEGLGADRYAAFALLNSLLGWYTVVDLGLGSALQNRLSEARARGESAAGVLRWAVGWILAAGLGFSGLTTLAAFGLGPWYLGATPLTPAEATLSFAVGSGLLILTTTSSVAHKIWYAQQRGHFAQIVPGVAALGGLVVLYFLTRAPGEANLAWCLVAALAPPALISLGALYFLVQGYGEGPVPGPEEKKRLWTKARDFSVLAVLNTGVLHVDYLVMSQTLGAADIVVYNVTTRVFDAMRLLYGTVLLALWPACTELIAKKEWPGVFRLVHKSLLAGMGSLLVMGALLPFLMPLILTILAPGADVQVPVSFIALITVFELVRAWCSTYGMVLYAVGEVRVFWWMLPAQTVINLAAQTYLAQRYGVHGVTAGLLLSFALTAAWVLPRQAHRVARAHT